MCLTLSKITQAQSIDLNQILITQKININYWIFQIYIKEDNFILKSQRIHCKLYEFDRFHVKKLTQ